MNIYEVYSIFMGEGDPNYGRTDLPFRVFLPMSLPKIPQGRLTPTQ